jgi:hypothetical protein
MNELTLSNHFDILATLISKRITNSVYDEERIKFVIETKK